jgi:hypothetical protein
MLLVALLALAVAAGGYYYLRKKDPNTVSLENDMIDYNPYRPLGAFEDPYYKPATFTDVYYYPSDQVPPMLQKTQGVLPYDPIYGCPMGYVPQQWYSQGGGPDYIGTPGMVRPVTFCQMVGQVKEDPYADPFGDGSSAFRDFASYHGIMTNLMVQQSNTIKPSTVFGDRFNIRPVVNEKGLQYGGLGRLPNPIRYPEWIY